MSGLPGKDAMPTGPLMIVISWPGDQDRGPEVYGPFDSEEHQMKWVDDCIESAVLGYEPLQGAQYLVLRATEPFNPKDLMP